MTPRLRLPRALTRLPALNSLRLQLLLWITLPVAISLLGMSAIEVRGHEQAMTQMVQQQADIVAHSLGVAINAHIEQREGILQRVAGEYLAGNDPPLSTSDTFAAGVTLLDSNGTAAVPPAPAWVTHPDIVALADEVATAQVPGLATLYDETSQAWLLVQAVPVPAEAGTSVLIGAEPVDALLHTYFVSMLDSGVFAQLQLMTSTGELLYSYTPSTSSQNDNATEIDPAQHHTMPWITGETIILPTGWQVLVYKDWRETVAPVLTFGNILLVTALVTSILAALSAYFALRNIVWPLQRLDEVADQVGWGNFGAIQQPVGGIAEIEELRLALARMTEQIRQYQQDLQSYIGAMTLGQEDERRRLARELHDETVQDLIALNQQVQMVERRLERDPDGAAEQLKELRPQIGSVIDGLRRQIHALRPLYLEDLGFTPAIEMLVRQVSQRHRITHEFTVTGDATASLAPTLQISAFRIVQEALQNVVKHAQADHVQVHLDFSDKDLTLTVHDNGQGFAAPKHPFRLAQQGHYGLLGIKERAELNGGTLQIDSRAGAGTSITVRLPRHQAATSSPSLTTLRS